MHLNEPAQSLKRTARRALSVPADPFPEEAWDEVQADPKNGDIVSGVKAQAVLRACGADGLMIGRGAVGRPWLFAEVRAALGMPRSAFMRAIVSYSASPRNPSARVRPWITSMAMPHSSARGRAWKPLENGAVLRHLLHHRAKHFDYYGARHGIVTFRKHLCAYLKPFSRNVWLCDEEDAEELLHFLTASMHVPQGQREPLRKARGVQELSHSVSIFVLI